MIPRSTKKKTTLTPRVGRRAHTIATHKLSIPPWYAVIPRRELTLPAPMRILVHPCGQPFPASGFRHTLGMNTVLHSTDSAEFLGLVPALAGFTPRQSIVLLPFVRSRAHGAMRIDLPQDDV